jgi:hypothetical protein
MNARRQQTANIPASVRDHGVAEERRVVVDRVMGPPLTAPAISAVAARWHRATVPDAPIEDDSHPWVEREVPPQVRVELGLPRRDDEKER